MKGALFGLLGIGLPLLLMMAGWNRWQNAGERTPPDRPGVRKPASGDKPANRAASGSTVEARDTDVPRSAEEFIDAIEDAWHSLHLAVRVSPSRSSGDKAADERRTAAGLLTQRRYDRALPAFDRLMVRAPNDPELMLGKAMALEGLDRHDDALPLLERVIELEPKNLPARFNLGVALMRLNQRKEAIQAFEEILRLEPRHHRAAFNLALLYQAAGWFNDAIDIWRGVTDGGSGVITRPTTSLDQALKSPGPACAGLDSVRCGDAWFHRGETAMSLHRSDEAETCFISVLQLQPDDVRAWCNLGIACAAGGRRKEALVALERALQIDPKRLPAINQMALLYADVYRETQDAASREMVLKLCDRSLTISPHQQNVRELRRALPAMAQTKPATGGLNLPN